MMEHGFAHLLGGLHRDEHGTGRRCQHRRARDQRHLRAAPEGRRREPVAHLAGGPVRDIAHRVDRLTRRAGGDEQPLAGEVSDRRQHSAHRLDDVLDLGEPSLAAEAGRERAGVGLEHRDAATAQGGDVGGDRRVLPHTAVHRRHHQHGRPGREQERGQEVVGDAVRRLREHVRGGRRHEDGVGALGQRDVLDGVGALRVEEVREHGPPGERSERERTHELARVLGEADRDRGAEPGQLA